MTTPSHELPRQRIMRQGACDADQSVGVDQNHGQDGAQLDQHLERVAGGVEAQGVTQQHQVSGGGHWNELGQAFDKPEQRCVEPHASRHRITA